MLYEHIHIIFLESGVQIIFFSTSLNFSALFYDIKIFQLECQQFRINEVLITDSAGSDL